MTKPVHLETRPERHLREYAEHKERYEQSRDINDALAAGRAWSRFLAEFIPDGPTKQAVHGEALRRQ
jgi:hypothetical protein